MQHEEDLMNYKRSVTKFVLLISQASLNTLSRLSANLQQLRFCSLILDIGHFLAVFNLRLLPILLLAISRSPLATGHR